jgi:NADPH2:quinone reductase
MKAVVLTAVGSPEVLQLQDIPKPEIKHDTELLVHIKAAGINPVDAKQRGRGTWYPSHLPQILGLDAAGIVEETGAGVKGFKKDDRVFFAHGGMGKAPGNYAEYTVVDERFCALMPASLSFAEAATAPSSLITAWECMFDKGELQEGQSILIHAGAGGVGHLAVQLARVKGARVCTTVLNEGQKEVAQKLGAEKIIISNREDFVKETLDWTNGRGVDVALDLVGGETFFKTFSCVKFYGSVIALLRPDPKYASWMEARLRNLKICYELMLTPMYYDLIDVQTHQTDILKQCAKLLETGKIELLIYRAFPLEKASEAHKLIEEGRTIGKIVLEI